MQAEIKRAEIAIQSLLHEKDSLKSALAASVKKKEEIYKVLLDYKSSLETANARIIELESNLDEVLLVKSEIEKVKKQLIRRDDKIKSLQRRNENLESLIEQQSMHESLWRKTNPDSTSEPALDPSSLSLAVDIMLQKVKSNKNFHKIFKIFTPCINSYRDLIDRNLIDEALIKTCKFSCELMKEIEKICFRDLSPMTESQVFSTSGNLTGFGSVHQTIDERYLSSNDEERCKMLNAEINDVCSSSRALLLNRSTEQIRNPLDRTREDGGRKEFNGKVEAKQFAIKINSGDNLKTPRNSARRPQQKIEIKSPEVKNSKSNPRQSILKRN